jgi:hypothetical protein
LGDSVRQNTSRINSVQNARQACLNAMGLLIWKIRQSCLTVSKEGWDTLFGQLEKYEKANGDCNVPTHHSKNVELGNWVPISPDEKRT